MSEYRKLLAGLTAFNRLICRGGLWLSAAFLAIMAITVAIQVFFRYVLNNSLSWAEDLSLMLMVWTAFLIIPFAYRRTLHVSIDMLPDMLGKRAKHALYLFFGIMTLVLTLYFIAISWDFTTRSTIMANAVPIRMKYVYAIMPISFVALVPILIEMMVRAALGLRDPADGDANLPPSVEAL